MLLLSMNGTVFVIMTIFIQGGLSPPEFIRAFLTGKKCPPERNNAPPWRKKGAPLNEKQRPPEKSNLLANLPPLTKSVTWDTVWLGWEGGANKRIPERRFALGQYVITRKDITGTKCPTINTHEQRILADILSRDKMCAGTLCRRTKCLGTVQAWQASMTIVPKFWEHLLKLSIP